MTAVACLGLVAAGCGYGPGDALAQARTTLDIYTVDVEGGNATLFVAPSGQSLLIDTGNFGPEASVRDAERIMAAAKDAASQIDNLIITHWHGDHFGGMAELAKRIPIRNFIDHGPNVQPAPAVDDFIQNVYPKLYANAKHTVAKVGDKIAVAGLDVTVVTSAGETLKTALPGAGAQSLLRQLQARRKQRRRSDVGRRHITFGKFRTMHLGDVTQEQEFELMCPMNKIGALDAFLGLHHAVNTSSSEVIIHALHPRVVIVNNGTRKGGQPDVMKILHSSPGLEDLWQIHFSQLSGQEYTVPGMFIANLLDEPSAAMPVAPIAAPAPGPNTSPPPAHNGPAFWIKVSAQPDGTFTVTMRNGFTKAYAATAGHELMLHRRAELKSGRAMSLRSDGRLS
jgi:beta-lactamase superfamily II metal-dependent hydrolase